MVFARYCSVQTKRTRYPEMPVWVFRGIMLPCLRFYDIEMPGRCVGLTGLPGKKSQMDDGVFVWEMKEGCRTTATLVSFYNMADEMKTTFVPVVITGPFKSNFARISHHIPPA